MDTIRVKGFFDELEKIALFGLGKNPNDPAVVFQKIAQVRDDRKITKERFQRFLRAAAAGAAGAGLGYGTGKLIGKPLEQKLVQYGMKVGPAKVLRYLVPTLGGLGAASMLARSRGTNELFRKIQGDNRNLNSPG